MGKVFGGMTYGAVLNANFRLPKTFTRYLILNAVNIAAGGLGISVEEIDRGELYAPLNSHLTAENVNYSFGIMTFDFGLTPD